MRRGMRVVHSRFYQGKPVRKCETCDKIVTTCWSYDRDTHVLSYGATVFTKSAPPGNKSVWNKAEHTYTATDRFKENPTKLVMLFNAGVTPGLRNVAIDWHIADKYIYKYGCQGKIGSVNVEWDFNNEYSYLKPTTPEKKYTLSEATEKLKDHLSEEIENIIQEGINNGINDYKRRDGWLCLFANAYLVLACYLYFV